MNAKPVANRRSAREIKSQAASPTAQFTVTRRFFDAYKLAARRALAKPNLHRSVGLQPAWPRRTNAKPVANRRSARAIELQAASPTAQFTVTRRFFDVYKLAARRALAKPNLHRSAGLQPAWPWRTNAKPVANRR